MRSALMQMTSSDDPTENLQQCLRQIRQAADEGAQFILTPEVTNCVSTSRKHQQSVLRHEDADQNLQALRDAAREHAITLLIGSLALRTQDADGRFANRSFLITPDGKVAARYDKIHMFDVDIELGETYRESAGYRPGTQAVLAHAGFAKIGMCVCYDMRFPHLAQALGRAGAEVLTYPSAFSPVTGKAHWETLLRARAIETGCWVLAPAQTGQHKASSGRPRETHGHSLVVDPWGNVTLDAGTEPGIYVFDLDIKKVDEARQRIPALRNKRDFDGP